MAARRYGRRLRRGATATAVAAAAMAALSASQAPGLLGVAHAASQGSSQEQPPVVPPPGSQIDGGSPYITDLPPLNTAPGPLAPTPGGGPAVTVPSGTSLPTTVLAAYQRAQAALALSQPGCHLPWQLLAAIGQVESGQARGGAVDANGTTLSPILGPVLNGKGFANIPDTDGGRWDGDPVHDRAVGPMQFIPSTWATWGADGNGDGVKDPNNVFDAALAAGDYLCANGRDLAVSSDMDRAILGYNHSQAYLNLVRAWYTHFMQGGAVSVPDRSGRSGSGVSPEPNPSTSPVASPTSPSSPPSPSSSGSSPRGPVSVGGTVSPAPPGTLPKPTTSPTGSPSTPPTTPPTSEPPTTQPPSTDPTTPTTPPTTPGCPTDSPSPSPSDSVSPSPTDSATADPCATPSDTPSPANTAGEATGSALTPSADATS
ncbi:lytic transglycosylase domain-containing protein [Streptomyces sp. NPDC020917]|uniref:lytic transglycosylase domain-containing protein n=1 Tax=Streptomyces sp. NPDC020917 TaxID=3365102 RepID=UPI0037908012